MKRVKVERLVQLIKDGKLSEATKLIERRKVDAVSKFKMTPKQIAKAIRNIAKECQQAVEPFDTWEIKKMRVSDIESTSGSMNQTVKTHMLTLEQLADILESSEQ